MPMQRELYPPNWPAISRRIRRMYGNMCARCDVPNGIVVARVGGWWYDVARDTFRDPDGVRHDAADHTGMWDWSQARDVKIVLTVSHRDHDLSHNDDDNLLPLCQWCHLTHDRELHRRHAAETIARRREGRQPQLSFS